MSDNLIIRENAQIFEIDLYRRLTGYQRSNDRKDVPFPFIIWGYFDWLKCVRIDKKTLFKADYHIKQSDEYQSYEIHRLYLYSPFDKDNSNLLVKDKKLPPLIVITELKLNDHIILNDIKKWDKNASSSPLQGLKQEIYREIEKLIIGNSSQDKKCGEIIFNVYSSLGYGDFLIVFRGSCYQEIISVINKFRAVPREYKDEKGKKQKRKLLRTTYSLTGVERFRENGNDKEKKYDVSLRVSLKSPLALMTVKNTIKKEITKVAKKYGYSCDEKHFEAKTVFGKYDLDLMFKQIPMSAYTSLFYKEEGLLYPENKFSKDYIGFTNTRWLLEIDENCTNGEGHSKTEGVLPQALTILNKYTDDLQNAICQSFRQHVQLWPNEASEVLLKPAILNKYPSYLQNAIGQLLRQYVQIIRNEASEMLLLNELKTIIRVFQQTVNKTKIPQDDEKKNMLFDNIRISVRIISEFMLSRVQASRMLFEMPVYNIHFIDSSTKYYMLYSTFVETIERLINDFEKNAHNVDEKLNFFTLLDFSEKINSRVLIPQAKEQQLIPICLNKMNIIDIRYNILLLAHETSHFIQPQDITTLFNSYRKAICNTLAQMITANLFLGDFPLIDSHLDVFKNNGTDGFKKIISGIGMFIDNEIDSFYSGKIFTDEKGKKFALNESENFKIYQEILQNIIRDIFCYIDKDVSERRDILKRDCDLLSDKEYPGLCKDIEKIINKTLDLIETGKDTAVLNSTWDFILNRYKNQFKGDSKLKENVKKIREDWSLLVHSSDKRKMAMTDKWVELIKGLSSPIQDIIDFVRKEGGEKDDKNDVILLLKHFASCRINEQNDENCKNVAHRIVMECNHGFIGKRMSDYMKLITILYNESIADYFMCKFLDLEEGHYKSLIKDFKKDNRAISQEEYINELELRIKIISKSIEKDHEVQLSDENVDLDGVVDAWKLLSCQTTVDFLRGECSQIWDHYYKEKAKSQLSDINHYLKISTGKDGVSFQDDINLLEKYWGVGIEMFRDK